MKSVPCPPIGRPRGERLAPSAELPASRLTGPPTTWTRGLRLGAWSRILVATPILFLASWLAQPQSVSHSSLLGMLPFAAILAIAAVGQTLVIQQGGYISSRVTDAVQSKLDGLGGD